MTNYKNRTSVALSALVIAIMAWANVTPLHGKAAQGAKTEIQKVPAGNVNPTSGKEMYTAYCASCHGPQGKGNGPAAAALKMPPADLTLLAKNNGGKFPDAKVQQAIKGDPDMPSAHGSKEMPVWGPTFWMLGEKSQAQEQLRIHNLASYVASLQQK
jgi:mono/diheme cytochrome c family protein